ncbi:MAG: hypothetical protein GY927_20310 [bacterium]|nr:hypothetical protein [bacterium]
MGIFGKLLRKDNTYLVVWWCLALLCIPASGHAQNGAVDKKDLPKIKLDRGDTLKFDVNKNHDSYFRNLLPGALIDMNKQDGTGYTGYQIQDIAEFSKKEKVIVGSRLTNVKSMRHVRDGRAIPKPLEIKSKTIKTLDTFLGAKVNDVGLVGHFRPKKPSRGEVLEQLRKLDEVPEELAGQIRYPEDLKKLDKVPDDFWSKVEERYSNRDKWFDKQDSKIKKLKNVTVKDGVVHAVVKNPSGSLETKPFAGDIDGVYFKKFNKEKFNKKTGKMGKWDYVGPGSEYERLKRGWLGLPDQPEATSFFERFKQSFVKDTGSQYWSRSKAPGQHGVEQNAVSDILKAQDGLKPGTPKARKNALGVFEGLAESHLGPDGEIIVEMHPDGHLRKGDVYTKENPLKNLSETKSARSAGNAVGDSGRIVRSSDELADGAKSAGRVMDAAHAGKASKALNKALSALDKLGQAADVAEAIIALAKLKTVYDTVQKARDPRTSDKEAAELFEKAEKLSTEIAGDASMFTLIEGAAIRFPNLHLPTAYLVWSIKCGFRDWGRTKGNCTKDHYNAAVSAWDKLFSDALARDQERAISAQVQCAAFRRAVKKGRAGPRWPYTVDDICDALKAGWSTKDMRDDDGAHLAARCQGVMDRVVTAAILLKQGKPRNAHRMLGRAKYWLSEYGEAMCSTANERVVELQKGIDRTVTSLIDEVKQAQARCRFDEANEIRLILPDKSRDELFNTALRKIGANAEAKRLLKQARNAKAKGDIAKARKQLTEASKLTPCPDTVARLKEFDESLRDASSKAMAARKVPSGETKVAALPKCKPVAPEPARTTYHLCGKPSVIYSSCWVEHCVTEKRINQIIQARHDSSYVKIKSKTACPPPKPDPNRKNCIKPDAKTASKHEGSTTQKPIQKPTLEPGLKTALAPTPEKQEPIPDKQHTRCAALNMRVDASIKRFRTGRIKTAQREMSQILTDLSELSGNEVCPSVQDRANDNIGKIAKVTHVLDDIKESLNECKPGRLRKQANYLKNATAAQLKQVRKRILRATPIAQKYTQAKLAFLGGHMDRSRSLFSQALARAREANGLTCKNIEGRIEKNIVRITAFQGMDIAAKSAIDTCDMTSITKLKSRLSKATNHYLKNVRGRLVSKSKKCRKEERDAKCVEDKGVGYYAGPMDKEGYYYCLPTKATADAHCRDNNKGFGLYAGKIRAKGGFECSRTHEGSESKCRTDYGKRYIKTTFGKGGSYTCHFCKKGQYKKNGKCYKRGKSKTIYSCPKGYYLKGKSCFSKRKPPRARSKPKKKKRIRKKRPRKPKNYRRYRGPGLNNVRV